MLRILIISLFFLIPSENVGQGNIEVNGWSGISFKKKIKPLVSRRFQPVLSISRLDSIGHKEKLILGITFNYRIIDANKYIPIPGKGGEFVSDPGFNYDTNMPFEIKTTHYNPKNGDLRYDTIVINNLFQAFFDVFDCTEGGSEYYRTNTCKISEEIYYELSYEEVKNLAQLTSAEVYFYGRGEPSSYWGRLTKREFKMFKKIVRKSGT